jgi:hypothetical protein
MKRCFGTQMYRMISGWLLPRILYGRHVLNTYYTLFCYEDLNLYRNNWIGNPPEKKEHTSWEGSRQTKRTMDIMDSVFNVNYYSLHDMISGVYAKQGRSVEFRLGRLPKGTRFHKISLTCCSFHTSHVHLLTGFLQGWMAAKWACSLQGLRTSQKVWFILTT